MLDLPTLQTERLILRSWNPAKDAEAVYSYASLPEATQYMLFDTHKSLADAQVFLSQAAGSPEHGFAITLEGGDDEPIGGTGISPVAMHRRAEMGYILHPDYWGRGIATEAAKRIIQYGFEDLGLNRIMARADVRNPASIRVLMKAGMSIEGTLRDEMIIRGRPCTFTVCSILRSEWIANRSRPAATFAP